ncbi:MAG: iron ABC transporter permease [Clostridia bacterium]|nr:iron ABC transporter permease [Clostridia bacterium]
MNFSPKSSIPKSLADNKRRRALIVLPLIALAAFCTAVAVGSSETSLGEVLRAMLSGEWDRADVLIVCYIRLPRALGALLAGAALAVSGVIIQAVLNNPMAAPNLIGVNAGAGFFVILAMAVFPGVIAYLPVAAFLGALLTALLIYAISSLTGAGRVTVTLIGVAVGSILTAGINTVKTLFPDSVYDVTGFLIGGLSSVSFRTVLPATVLILPALAVAVLFAPVLDALSLGTSVAGGIGVSVRRARFLWLVLAAILAGAAVSYAGLIGFVGLIVPHILRRLVGGAHRWLIPVSIFGGGAFLLIADTVARLLFAPYELPVGILLSLVGGPFFIGLLLWGRRSAK